ncbi:helix-turn-helix transcriptional regulator [Streptomyces amakusaensis]|uniref:ArsR/SmtB family transcription factor n=1 Tax=Streptomyces amakusaensis TaxID=67271 RepID=A0ABW0AM44_9ACTN
MDDRRYAWLPEPDLDRVELGTVLQALADPVRLRIVRLLDTSGEGSCSTLDVTVKRSTVSHHLRTLRESGLVSTRIDGNARFSRLRRQDLERRFPGLLDSVLSASPARP